MIIIITIIIIINSNDHYHRHLVFTHPLILSASLCRDLPTAWQ